MADFTSNAEPRRSKRLRTGPSSATDQPESSYARRRKPQRKEDESSIPSTSHAEDETSAMKEEEDIAEDDLCPICRLLLFNPVTTTCNHTLCSSCMAHWADVSISQQMTIVPVTEQPEDFNPVSGLEARCPMCRTQTVANRDNERANRLKAAYPRTWIEREAEESEAEGGEGSIQPLTVYVGNTHRLVGAEAEDDEKRNCHEWAFFVRPSRTDIVEEVQFLLHPTFRPSRIIRQRAPYEIRRLGWGYFTLVAYVILKAGYSWVSDDAQDSPDGAPKGMLPLEWTLDFSSFEATGSMGRCRLKVKNDRQWHDVSDEEGRDEAEWNRVVRSYQADGRWEPEEDGD